MKTNIEREYLSIETIANSFIDHLSPGGVLCSVIDSKGKDNLITLGWALIGDFNHGNPMMTIAITPQRYSYRFLEEVQEFVIGIPDESIAETVLCCGTLSGRDIEKFDEYNLTRVPSVSVRPPAIRECPINIECKVYTMVKPPHMLLTPRHREQPLSKQHTIYFADILHIYKWKK